METTDKSQATAKKIIRARKPKIKLGPNSVRFGVTNVKVEAEIEPCSMEVLIATNSPIGTPQEAEQIQALCQAFNGHPELCSVIGYGIHASAWKVQVSLKTGGKDVDDDFLSKLSSTLTPIFKDSPAFKRDHGFGKASYRVLNIGTTVESGEFN